MAGKKLVNLRLLISVALTGVGFAQSYSVQLTGGKTGSVKFTGLSSYSGDYRVDARFKGCTNPNTGAVHNLISGVMSLQWAATSNVLQARDWNSTSSISNVITLNAAAWPADWEIRYQRIAATRISMEKWDASGGGYVVNSIALSGTNPINFSTLTLGAATLGCEVAFVRVYLDDVPLGSAPPSAMPNPHTGVLRAWEFNDQANPAEDSSGNGGSMTFSATPNWIPEDRPLACWASVSGNSVAGSPITLAAYTRGTASSRVWQITSQPSLNAARLSSYTSATPSLLNAVAGSYSFRLHEEDGGGGVANCTTTQTITAPASGTGGYLGYSVGVKLDSHPDTDSVRISVVQPNGSHVVGSPYRCWSSPCQIYVDDTGMGSHTFRIERLNASEGVIGTADWSPLKTTQVALAGTPVPEKPALPKLMAVAYGSSGPLADKFVGTRFDIRIAGGNPRSYNPAIKYSQYRDGSGFYYAGEYWTYRLWMESKGWSYEAGLLHAYVDHGNVQAWTKVNKFGEDQWNSINKPSKGVMIWNGTTFLTGPADPADNQPTPDHSQAAWNTTTGDVPLGNGTLYIGYPEPFDLVNVVASAARTGGSVVWEYCSAAAAGVCTTWSTLGVTDPSAGFSATAGPVVRTITFTPPGNWTAVSVNNSKPSFYIRAVVSGASTTPILSRVYGDEWNTYGPMVNVTNISSNLTSPTVTTGGAHGYVPGDVVNIAGLTGGWATAIDQWERVTSVPDSTHFVIGANTSSLGAYPGGSVMVQNRDERGWDPSDANIVTVAGGYQYNPTPPPTATAKFRYQSRVRSFFASTNDQFMFNDNAKDSGGIVYWGRYLAEGTVSKLHNGAYNGMMLDNADAIPENVWIYNDLDWADKPYTYSSILIRNKKATAVGQLRSYLRSFHPDAVLGGNATYRTASICAAMDFCLLENRITAGSQYNFGETANVDGDPIVMFDTVGDPAVNPHCSVAYVAVWSSDTLDPLDSANVQYWFDKADRRPMLALGTFYTGWNGDPCMGFAWNAHTFTYSQDDDFYYMAGDTTLTSPITGHLSNLQSFTIADTSQLWSNLAGMEMAMVIGEPPNADYVGVASWSGNTINTNGAVIHSWPVGTKVRVRKIGHQGSTPIPWERLLWPSIWFPAMAVSLGTPVDPTPGGRKLAWKTPAEYGGAAGSANMSLREYTNGIVVIRPLADARTVARMNGCSTNAMDLGGAYYRLHVDGKTEAAPYTSIKLREGEAFIGLKSPTAKATEVPAWQQNTCP